MSDTDEPQYRQYLRADREGVSVRDVEENDDGTFSIRMPIASTGEVRNQGDDPLTREELDGMAEQLADRQIGVFPAHGRDSTIASGRYSPFEKMGYWDGGEVEEREESDDALLIADARLMDPDDLPNVGPMREGLGVLKEQAKRGIAQDASIGWRDDESFPGGVDLMEASIVGIGADWRTNTATETAMARAAVEAGADPEAFIDAVRDAVMGANDTDDDMTDEDTDEPPESIEHHGREYVLRDEDGETTDDEQTERDDTPEWVQTLLENQNTQTEILQSLADAIREDDDDEDDDEDDEEENESDEDEDDEDENEGGDDDDEDDDDEDEENSQAADDVAELRDAYDRLQEGGVDVSDLDLPDPDDEQDAETDDDTTTHDADPDEDATKALLR